MTQLLLILSSIVSLSVGCAYNVGYSQRSLPEGYSQLSIPVFANQTDEVGIEAYFTNDMIREFERSRVAKVVSSHVAPLRLEGVIQKLEIKPSAQVKAGAEELENLPANTVLTIEYRLLLTAHVRLRRASDQKVIWESSFDDERVYQAPQIALQGFNSANAVYNHSARHEYIRLIAKEMMTVAHDRMTENF